MKEICLKSFAEISVCRFEITYRYTGHAFISHKVTSKVIPYGLSNSFEIRLRHPVPIPTASVHGLATAQPGNGVTETTLKFYIKEDFDLF